MDLKRYANEKGVRIIGDIPIFVSMDSADVWGNQHLFQLDTKGFPTAVAEYRRTISLLPVSSGAIHFTTGMLMTVKATSGGLSCKESITAS